MKDADTRERDRLLEHEYDGIREYDNPLPAWWTWIFVATVVFSVGSFAYYELGPGPTIIAQYDAEMRQAAERQAPVGAVKGAPTDESIKRLRNDATVMAAARGIFSTRCAPCHGPVGVSLAMAGRLNPLVAAVLMPLSSLTVILTSYRARTFSLPVEPDRACR